MAVACFTGHRPNKLNGYDPKANKEMLWRLRASIIDCIENQGVDTFISGMALGVDTWAARIVIRLRATDYPHIKLIAAVPCKEQWAKWGASSKAEWEWVIERADEVHYVTKGTYTNWCMQRRNEWMVDRSDIVIAVWDGSRGGTGNCVDYAKSAKKEIITLDPK